MTVIVIIVVSLALFALGYLARRRFGVLGLALAAGSLLANSMTRDLSRIINEYNVPVEPLSTVTAASVFLTLLPALVLLLGGPTYKKRRQSIWGAIAFAAMAMLLILGPLTSSLPPDQLLKPFVHWVTENNSVLLAIGIIVAVVDAWLIKNRVVSPEEDKKKK